MQVSKIIANDTFNQLKQVAKWSFSTNDNNLKR
jgi:hypothetical protein